MNWQLLFSFRGRISRAIYWLLMAIGFLFLALLIGIWRIGGLWLVFIPALAFLIFDAAIAAKRLHDRNKSAWWLLVYYILPALLSVTQILLQKMGQTSLESLGFACNMLGGIISIWVLVELGFFRGTIGPNRYGPDPLAQTSTGGTA